jgi:PAS domain S-box-containing protein
MNSSLTSVHEEVLRKEIETLRRKLMNVRSRKGRMSGPGHYLSILDDLPDLLCLFSPDGAISYANTSFCTYFCRNRYEPVGTSIYTYIPRKDRKRFARNMEKLTEQTPLRGFEFISKSIAGEARWHQWTLKALLNSSGNPVEYILAGRDITSLKSMEEDLIDALEKYATLFESTRDAIVIHDNERLLDCNRAALAMFNLQGKDLFLHSTFLDLSLPGPTDRKSPCQELHRHFDRAFRHGQERFQCLCRRADASPFPADILMSPFPLGTRNVLSSVIRDITDLKATEEELKTSCADFQIIIRDLSRELRQTGKRLEQETQKRKKAELHLKKTEENFKRVSCEVRAMRRKTS